ncbi:TNF receptor-associated factor, partial [Parasponia andersonii]
MLIHAMLPLLAGALVSGTEESQEVTELGTHVDNILPYQIPDTHSQSPSGGRGVGSAQARRQLHGSSTPSGGRRAQMMSGNHLLNFHYNPISRPQPRAPPRRQDKVKPYNKDLFLQANYKFVVLDSGNYMPESMDPDKMLRWEDIICVRYSTPSTVQCPICLESPICPQITSCGHIFCFPCILRYLLMGKEDAKGDCWKRCPLCFLMISPKDLYTLFIENVKQYTIGDKVEFSLLTRQKDSYTLSHKDKVEKHVSMGSPEESYDPFSKFTFTSDGDLSVRKAIADLDGWLVRADSGLVDDLEKLPYVCAAMEQLEQRKKYWDEHQACDSVKSSKSDRSTGPSAIQPTADASNSNSEVLDSKVRALSPKVNGKNKHLGNSGKVCLDAQICSDHFADVSESLGGQENVLSSSYDESNEGNLNGSGDVKEKGAYNFYQAADGQHIILHPLNMKCLLYHFGSHDLLPDRICGKILQLETVTQSEAIRRRLRFLSHFSLTTTLQLCEIDLREFLPPDALIPFMDEIKRREKQRKQLARK